MPVCTGQLGVMGICLGGHLAFRATACFYATDIHTSTLGKGKSDNSLQRVSEIEGELLMIISGQDPHVPLAGRNQIRARLEEAKLFYSWHEVNAANAFLRDEGPRCDQVLALQCLNLALELFHRKL